jgi:hypothetical protein
MTTIINGSSPSITFSDGSAQTSATRPFLNRIINGAMVIDQRNAGASVTPTVTGYTLDRWVATLTESSKFSVQQNAGSVTPPNGFRNYLGVTSLSSYAVISTDSFTVVQRIEGFNFADLEFGTANASSVTVSFWVRSSLTGTFGGSLRNGDTNRSYPYTYTISVANTWEYKTVTIPGDTSGTWNTTNGQGASLFFGLGAGSTFSGTAGAWNSNNNTTATGATSVVGTNGATFYITGVQLEKGSTATSFDYRPYGTELALCQRYYYRLQAGVAGQIFGVGYVGTTSLSYTTTQFPIQMRTSPSALEQNGTAADYRVNNLNSTTVCNAVPIFEGASTNFAGYRFTTGATLVAGQGCAASCQNTNAFLAWSAEL